MPRESKFLLFTITTLALASAIHGFKLSQQPRNDLASMSANVGVLQTPSPSIEKRDLIRKIETQAPRKETVPTFQSRIQEILSDPGLANAPKSEADLARETDEVMAKLKIESIDVRRMAKWQVDRLKELCIRQNAYACEQWYNVTTTKYINSKEFESLPDGEQASALERATTETSAAAAYACALGHANACRAGMTNETLADGRGLKLLLTYCDSGNAAYCREAASATLNLIPWQQRGPANANSSTDTVAVSEAERQALELYARGCDLGNTSSCMGLVQNSSGPADDPKLQYALLQLEDGCTPGRDPLSYLASCGTLSEFYSRVGNIDLSKHYLALGCAYGREQMCETQP